MAKAKKKVGRPSKKDSIHYEGLKLCYSRGFTDTETALALQITPRTLENWKKQDPEFFQTIKDSKGLSDSNVKKSLYERACGWSDGTKVYPPDTTACIFWLKNRQPAKWRDVQKLEHSGEVAHTVAVEIDFDEIRKRRGDK